MRGSVTIVVDNPSWIIPYAKRLLDIANTHGYKATFIENYALVPEGDIAFYLGCLSIANEEALAKNKLNLVIHESDLPLGRGFAPVAWQIINGASSIPVVLIKAEAAADSGAILERDELLLTGYELNDELRLMQGQKTVELCEKFLIKYPDYKLEAQTGSPTYFRRRFPEDSRLDLDKTLREQFNLLRIVDNEDYPAFFEINGHRYELRISHKQVRLK